MFRTFVAIFALLGLTAAPAAQAGGPVVVELYTSQGCSSCPPADALLHKLAKRDDVIALALHVDYWDYIGWKDEFANPAHTKRQKSYARVAKARTIYTPQMVIGGKDHVIGARPMEVADLVNAHAQMTPKVAVALVRDGDVLTITAGVPAGGAADMWVQLVRFENNLKVDIRRGENAGRTITYANVVRSWERIGEWSGAEPLEMTAQVRADGSYAVIVQSAGYGPILGAAQLR